MQKMSVYMPDIGRHFGRQDQRLSPSPDTVRRRIAGKIGEPGAPRLAVPRQHAGPMPAGENAARRVLQILGQIQYRRPDSFVHRMARAIGRMSQRYDLNVETAPFERRDLLRDE